MDMKIDSDRVKRERQQRAWTQEHLAGASGISLRTIQRIETTGTASCDSLNALAAVFSLSVADLRIAESEAGATSAQVPAPERWWTARRVLTLIGAQAVASVLAPPMLVMSIPLGITLWLSLELGLIARRKSRLTPTP